MEKRKMIQILICCSCFLAVIYGIAHFDKGHRRYTNDDMPTMAENKQKSEMFTRQHIMYITFDDGPGQYTQDILDILDQYHIKATFFVTGSNSDYTHLINTIQEEGHALGLHSFSHDYAKIYSSVEAYFDDLGKISALVKKETDSIPNLIRFPGGSSNTISKKYSANIMTKLSEHCENLGYSYYDWNVECGDENPSLSADQIYDTVIQNIQGKEEVMLLLHDGNDNKNTMIALDRILKELVRQGWEFRIIDASANSFHHHIAN